MLDCRVKGGRVLGLKWTVHYTVTGTGSVVDCRVHCGL